MGKPRRLSKDARRSKWYGESRCVYVVGKRDSELELRRVRMVKFLVATLYNNKEVAVAVPIQQRLWIHWKAATHVLVKNPCNPPLFPCRY